MPQSISANEREKIRLHIRHTRNHLSQEFQLAAADSLVKQIINCPEVQAAKTIALYLANDGELNTMPFIKWCWQNNKQVALPVLHPFKKGHLLFLNYQPHTLMKKNRFNIAEPKLAANQVVPIQSLDVICTPLVAFDNNGQRLGMGGGFYDRTLAFQVKDKSIVHLKPVTLGLAHDCQQVETVPVEPWDVPIPKIVTPTRIITAN